MSRQTDRRKAQLAKKQPPSAEVVPTFWDHLRGHFRKASTSQTILGFLPGGLSTIVTAAIGYVLDYGAFVLLLSFFGVWFAVEFILWGATTRGRRAAALTILSAAVLVAAGSAVYTKWSQDRAYVLTPGSLIVLRSGIPTAEGGGQVTGVNLGVFVQNRTKDSIFYRVKTRYGEIENHSSSMFSPPDEVAPPAELRSNEEFGCRSDLIPAWLTNGHYHDGEIQCVVEYGKTKDKLAKRFTYKTKVQFFLCPVSGNICGQPGSNGEEMTNEWIR